MVTKATGEAPATPEEHKEESESDDTLENWSGLSSQLSDLNFIEVAEILDLKKRMKDRGKLADSEEEEVVPEDYFGYDYTPETSSEEMTKMEKTTQDKIEKRAKLTTNKGKFLMKMNKLNTLGIKEKPNIIEKKTGN